MTKYKFQRIAHVAAKTAKTSFYVATGLVAAPAFCLSIWGFVYWNIGDDLGRYHPKDFLNAPGAIQHVSGQAFEKNQGPCEVASFEILSFKMVGENKVMYSCNRWWLDNVIVKAADILTAEGSKYYALSHGLPKVMHRETIAAN